MEAINGLKKILKTSDNHTIHPHQDSQWKQKQLDGASELFTRGTKSKDKEEG